MRLFASVRLPLSGLFTLLMLLSASAVHADDWGTIKGQVVYGGNKIPAPVVLNVDKDKAACLAVKKELLSEEWVIDPKTKGVKWVYVYLMLDSRKDADLVKPIPTNPKLIKKELPKVEVDQPCCMFEPYAIALQSGQSIKFKNSMAIAHNVKVDGGPAANQLIPPGNEHVIGPFKPQSTPIPMSCSIHGWMSGYIRVFSHPYFIVTKEDGEFEIKDAPAGKYRLVIWHPGQGWVVGDDKNTPDKFGIQINIKANETTDLGKFKVEKKEEKK